MSVGVYKLTNLLTGACYIGQSWNVEQRFTQHRQARGNYVVSRALRKYGAENFAFELIASLEDTTQEALDALEVHWIQHFRAVGTVYNVRDGGSRGKHSEETKRKMGVAKSGQVFSDEARARMSESHRGKTQSEETKEKHRQAWLGQQHSAESKELMSAAQRGREVSDTTREKLRAIRVGKKHTPESLAKMQGLHVGFRHTEEVKARMSAVHTGKTASPAARLAMSEAAKRRCKRQAEERRGVLAENEPVVFTKARAEGKSEELPPVVLDTSNAPAEWWPYASRVEGKVRDTCCPGHRDDPDAHSPGCPGAVR